MPIAAKLEMPALSLVMDFLKKKQARAWLAGGTVRDLLRGGRPWDVDLVTIGDPVPLAREFADSIGGSFFVLSEEFLTCRVVDIGHVADAGRPAGSLDNQTPTPESRGRFPDHGPTATYDFAACRAGSIEADLALRDFTVDAMAIELPDGERIIDPLSGQADLKAGRLAAVSRDIFRHDPLRMLRALRLEKTTGLAIDPSLEKLIREHRSLAADPAPERVFPELACLLEPPGAARGVRRLDRLDLLPVLFPEVQALKGVAQNEYHHLDVYEHSLANCEALERIIADPERYFPGQAKRLEGRSRRRFTGGVSWGFVLCFTAVMHDIGKPETKFIDEGGQVRFFEHDRRGAVMVAGILGRLKASAEITGAISFLVRKHLRFEGLIQQPVPSERARLRYLRATEPYSPEAIVLSVSDRLSVRGPLVTEADVERHLQLAREMMSAAFAEAESEPPPRLIGGDELMEELSLGPGPLIGRLLERVLEEQKLGNISTREEALEVASGALQEEQPPGTNDQDP